MPFDNEFDWLHRVLVEAGRDAGVDVERADDIFTPGIVIDQIKQRIDRASAILAVCTDRNPNVFYELGIAENRHKPILIAEHADDLPFDVQHFRAQCYGRDAASPERANFPERIVAALIEAVAEGAAEPRTYGLITHLGSHEMISERTAPMIMFKGIWFENLDNRTCSVLDVSVTLLAPVSSRTKTTMWREAGRPVGVSRGCNIPARGRSEEFDILVHLDTAFSTSRGEYSAEVAAVGPGGAPGDSIPFAGMYEIADS